MTGQTLQRTPTNTLPVETVRVVVVEGSPADLEKAVAGERLAIGTAEGNDLVLSDPTISRFHLSLEPTPGGALVLDGSSTNGTFFEGARVERAVVPFGATLTLGESRVRVEAGGERAVELLDAAADPRFARFAARSAVMQRLLAQLVRAAGSEAPVLLAGESGTGKELLARALHELGPRAARPFETVDCASLSPTLVGSELFGHEKGAFTGADRRHVGAFERADGGTIFLDEVGELSESLQPMLLGALERRRFRRLGGREEIRVDVRVVSATHRELRAEVNAQRFRLDLYYRLAVIPLAVPPLRERRDDLPLLVEQFAAESSASPRDRERVRDASFLAALARHDWPGNVRELRNVVDATLAMGEMPPLERGSIAPPSSGDCASLEAILDAPYKEARQRLLHDFEARYLPRLLERASGNVSQAARDADMDRSHLFELLRRHGLR